jgi:hypothetical protein
MGCVVTDKGVEMCGGYSLLERKSGSIAGLRITMKMFGVQM